MKVRPTGFEGLLLIELEVFADSRGSLRETFRADRYRVAGISDEFVQEIHSYSTARVLRGLHFRRSRPQAQLVTVTRGRIFDVVVDIRPDSATFGNWHGAELSAEGVQQTYMAPGFAHGFCVLSEDADLHYKVSQTFDQADEAGILWSDPDLAIAWPVDEPVVSPRDSQHPRLVDSVHVR